jgi:AraC family transcriptional regulator
MARINTERTVPVSVLGLEQFRLRGDADGVTYCISGDKPYALEMSNDTDVICLALGDIVSRTKFEDDREGEVTFLGESMNFHPRGGHFRVKADEVRHGFIAFGYSDGFRDLVDDVDIEGLRRAGSQNNLRNQAIRSLVTYARERRKRPEALQAFELQFLATAAYLETMRRLEASSRALRQALSDRQFEALSDYIEAHLDGKISCASLVREVNLPLRVIFDGVKARTGRSPYSLVIEKRVRRAREMLLHSDASIADIAAACGFCSQQHMTGTLSRKLGITPQQLRLGAALTGRNQATSVR